MNTIITTPYGEYTVRVAENGSASIERPPQLNSSAEDAPFSAMLDAFESTLLAFAKEGFDLAGEAAQRAINTALDAIANHAEPEEIVILVKPEEVRGHIIGYIKELLEYLDGNGLIVTDDDMIDEALRDCGDFSVLRGLLAASPQPTSGEVAMLKVLRNLIFATTKADAPILRSARKRAADLVARFEEKHPGLSQDVEEEEMDA